MIRRFLLVADLILNTAAVVVHNQHAKPVNSPRVCELQMPSACPVGKTWLELERARLAETAPQAFWGLNDSGQPLQKAPTSPR